MQVGLGVSRQSQGLWGTAKEAPFMVPNDLGGLGEETQEGGPVLILEYYKKRKKEENERVRKSNLRVCCLERTWQD